MSKLAKKIISSGSSGSGVETMENLFEDLKSIGKKLGSDIKVNKVPLEKDLILKILTYISEGNQLFPILMLNKEMYQLLTLENPSICRNIIFQYAKPVKLVKELQYVYKMKQSFIPGFEEGLFRFFPNLVECNINWNITVLYLTDEIFRFMPNIERIRIRDCCAIYGKGFGLLKKLTKLSILYNNKVEDEAFKDLTNLKDLTIHNCPKILGSLFKYLKSLEYLTIRFVKDEFDTSDITCLKSLKKLDIEYSFCNLEEDVLNSLKKLNSITIWSCVNIYDIVISKNPKNIREFHIGNNPFFSDEIYEDFINLRKLTVWNCGITGELMYKLSLLTELKILDHYDRFKDSIFRRLQSLRKLAVFKSQSIYGRDFNCLEKLTNFWIRENNNISLKQLKMLKGLKVLVVICCEKMTQNDINTLKEEKPGLKAYYKKTPMNIFKKIPNLMMSKEKKNLKNVEKNKQIIEEFRSF